MHTFPEGLFRGTKTCSAFMCSSSPVKCSPVGGKTLPCIHPRTCLLLFPVPSLQSPLTIALSPHEAADTIEMTSVAVSLTRHSSNSNKVMFYFSRLSLHAFPLCCFSPWRPSSLIQHALRISVTSLARSLETMRLCAVSPGFWFYLTL